LPRQSVVIQAATTMAAITIVHGLHKVCQWVVVLQIVLQVIQSIRVCVYTRHARKELIVHLRGWLWPCLS